MALNHEVLAQQQPLTHVPPLALGGAYIEVRSNQPMMHLLKRNIISAEAPFAATPSDSDSPR